MRAGPLGQVVQRLFGTDGDAVVSQEIGGRFRIVAPLDQFVVDHREQGFADPGSGYDAAHKRPVGVNRPFGKLPRRAQESGGWKVAPPAGLPALHGGHIARAPFVGPPLYRTGEHALHDPNAAQQDPGELPRRERAIVIGVFIDGDDDIFRHDVWPAKEPGQ